MLFLWSVQLTSETIFILRRIKGEIESKIYIDLHVKYSLFLSGFNEMWIFSKGFESTQLQNLMKICPVVTKLFHADRRSDVTKLIVAFRSFANGPTEYLNMTHCDNNVLILVGWSMHKFFFSIIHHPRETVVLWILRWTAMYTPGYRIIHDTSDVNVLCCYIVILCIPCSTFRSCCHFVRNHDFNLRNNQLWTTYIPWFELVTFM